ncbi:NfeD family protein [Alkalibacillus aidingensis]|uniref:hypothetical protein n=1 Tax=Alkalibacillus aidingensis TaxID=2747607 RepID=UPI0016616BD0|nr:hypothetical protein [Alkalibacillus aidingensis]
MNSFSKVDIKIPFSFILFSLIALVASQWIVFQNVDLIVEGVFRVPNLWMATHLLILGFAVMVVMGAMYQMVPVVFMTPIWSERFGYLQFWVTALGIIWLSVSLGVKLDHVVYGGAVAVTGVLMFLFQMFMSMKKQKEKTIVTWLVTGALISFLLTVIGGLLLAINFSYGQLFNHESLIKSHVMLGVVGWFTLLIIGFSYQLVPMFSLSHNFSMKWSKKLYVIYVLGIICLIISFWLDYSPFEIIGWLLLVIGFTLFLLDMREILTKRSKKRLDRSFLFATFAIYFGWVTHIVALIISLLGLGNAFIWGWLVYLYLMTWVIFSILGYLKKIVPVLWWTLKYSDRVGKEKDIPTIKDLVNEKAIGFIYIGVVTGTLGFAFALLIQNALLIQLFQGLILLSVVCFSISIGRIIFK